MIPPESKVLRRRVLPLVLLAFFCALPQARTAEPVEPYRGLAYTAKDVVEVRRLAAETAEGAVIAAAIEKKAAEWMKRSDEEIIALVPANDALFAHGYAGDPKTGQAWPRFGRSDDVCSLDRPGQVKSPYTGDIYGIQKPGEKYYDDGKGWTRAGDGRVFYFKALWNSYVVDQLHEGLDYLSLAYMLNGDPAIARRALLILDRLATLRAASPYKTGLVDSVNDRKKDVVTFMRYSGNIANQRAINSALAFDLIARAPYASEPSAGDTSKSVRQNIEDNYFALYEKAFYLDMRGSLGNHGCILFGNVIAQGVLFGRPELLKTGIDALYAFIDSTINRDGDYVELAGGYGRLGRDYGSRLVALLQHYDRDQYPNAAEMPARQDYPYDLRIANEPRWYQTVIGMLYRLPVAGRYPQYGDVNADRDVLLDRDNAYLEAHRRKYLRIFHEQTTREDWKREIEVLYAALPKNTNPTFEVEDLLLLGVSQWKDVSPPPADAPPAAEVLSDLMGGKNIAILRSGSGPQRRALFMRGGPNGLHGHDDQLSVVPYGHGMVLAGVYGYNTSETPDHLSWGSRAISHLSAVVNEDLPPSYLYKGFGNRMNRGIFSPAACVTGYVGMPPAQFVEMSNPGMWSHVRSRIDDYRRTSWLIDIDDEQYYFVDLFRILGGRTHDYIWNAPYAARSAEAMQLDGVAPQPIKDVWTLAALSGKNRNADWNKPGQSWGERLDGMAGGIILPLRGQKNEPGLSGQKNPPVAPGNGYGMIWDIKAADTDKDWEAVWKLPDGKNFMRSRLINFDGMTAISGKSPTILRDRYFNVIVARRQMASGATEGIRSRFVNVVEVGHEGAWGVEEVEKLGAKDGDGVGIKVRIRGGKTDYVFSNREGQSLGDGNVQIDGRNGFARLDQDGSLVHLLLQEGTSIKAGGWILAPTQPVLEAKVLSVKASDDGEIILDRALPAGIALDQAMMLVRRPSGVPVPCTHDEYFAIEESQNDGEKSILRFHKQSLVLASTQVENIDAATGEIECRWPSEIAGPMGAEYLRGHAVEGLDAVVKSFVRNKLVLTSAQSIEPGQRLRILAAQPGDSIIIPSTAILHRIAADTYRLRSTTDLQLTIPGTSGTKVLSGEKELGVIGDSGPLSISLPAGESLLTLKK